MARMKSEEDSVNPLRGRRFLDEKEQARIDQIRETRGQQVLRAGGGAKSVKRRIILIHLESYVVKRIRIPE